MHVRVLGWLDVTDREGVIRPCGKSMMKRHEMKGDGRREGPGSRRLGSGWTFATQVYGEIAD